LTHAANFYFPLIILIIQSRPVPYPLSTDESLQATIISGVPCYRRPAIFCHPKSREMADAHLSPPFLSLLLTANWDGPLTDANAIQNVMHRTRHYATLHFL